MAIPPPPAPLPDQTPTQPRGYLQLGTHEFGPGAPSAAARCVVTIKPKAKGKVDEKAAQGKDDAKTTWQGKEPADLEITIQWNTRDAEADQAIEDRLADLNPRGPNGGLTLTIAARRLRIHAVDTVIIKEMDGPEDKPGTTLVDCKITCASISAQAQAGQSGQGDAKTPTDPQKGDGTPTQDPSAGGKSWTGAGNAPAQNNPAAAAAVSNPVPTVKP
jgi:hypothetical protein